MWICFSTPLGAGFMSIVGKNEDNQPSDTMSCLRFRREEDAKVIQAILGRAAIIETPAGDYGWRIYQPREKAAELMRTLTMHTSYPNFKDSIGEDDHELEDVLHDAWKVFGELQPGGPYGGFADWWMRYEGLAEAFDIIDYDGRLVVSEIADG